MMTAAVFRLPCSMALLRQARTRVDDIVQGVLQVLLQTNVLEVLQRADHLVAGNLVDLGEHEEHKPLIRFGTQLQVLA